MAQHASFDEDLMRQVEILGELARDKEALGLVYRCMRDLQTEGFIVRRLREALIKTRRRLERYGTRT